MSHSLGPVVIAFKADGKDKLALCAHIATEAAVCCTRATSVGIATLVDPSNIQCVMSQVRSLLACLQCLGLCAAITEAPSDVRETWQSNPGSSVVPILLVSQAAAPTVLQDLSANVVVVVDGAIATTGFNSVIVPVGSEDAIFEVSADRIKVRNQSITSRHISKSDSNVLRAANKLALRMSSAMTPANYPTR